MSKAKVDESKFVFEFSHQRSAKDGRYGVGEDGSLTSTRSTFCTVYDKNSFESWLADVRKAKESADAHALAEVKAKRPSPILRAEARCRLDCGDNFSRKTGRIKSKGRALKFLTYQANGGVPTIYA